MILRLLVSMLALATIAFSSAQVTADERARKSGDVLDKATRLDLLNQILPILFTKEQYREILPAIERARQKVRETEKLEAAELAKLEPKLDAALKDANEKGAVPPRELLNEVAAVLRTLGKARSIISGMNTQAVYEVFDKTANAGQKKAAANALNPKMFDPSLKVDEMKDEDKIRVFVREILLHPMAYEIMRKLSL